MKRKQSKSKTRHKRGRVKKEDIISSLPDCLLVEIISRLPDTKYAIRTGTLSKRWQHLWTQVSNLIISRLSGYNNPQFYSSVEKITSQRGQLNLNIFKLHATYSNQSEVITCIRNAINHNVQEVDLYLSYYPCNDGDNGFVLPEFFFIRSSFIHLTLSNCIFKQAGVVSWKNLKTLCIKDAELYQDVIKNLLSGSPLLETLMLYRCYGFELLDITNKSVKNLVFSGYNDEYIYSVEINAPYILSLTIQYNFSLEKLLLLNMSSVIKAELNYCADLEWDDLDDEENEEMLKGLLLSLGNAKEVIIGEFCLESLTGLKAKGFMYPSNLKVLGEINSS